LRLRDATKGNAASLRLARRAEAAAGPRVIAARYHRASHRIEIGYENGVTVAVPVALIQEFEFLAEPPSAAGLSKIHIAGERRYVEFPRIGASLYAPSLLKGIYGTEAWMAARWES
jgi:hypothetical protein